MVQMTQMSTNVWMGQQIAERENDNGSVVSDSLQLHGFYS